MRPRIAPLDAVDEEQRAELAKTPWRPDGQPLNVFATLARRPQLLRRVNAMGGYFPRNAALPAREREIVILRIAARVGSPYMASQHRVVAARDGLTPAEVEAALDPHTEHPWGAADRALLAVAEELLASHTVSDATWAALDGHIDDDGERLELVVLVGFYTLMGGLLNAVGIELDAPYAA